MADSRAAKARWRPWLRAVHRDVGYLAVGLTLVYALSGLAVNHIADWDPNFKSYEHTSRVALPLPADDTAAPRRCWPRCTSRRRRATSIARARRSSRSRSTSAPLHVDSGTGRVVDEGQEPRFFLRAANWLHLNRGKKAWR